MNAKELKKYSRICLEKCGSEQSLNAWLRDLDGGVREYICPFVTTNITINN